MSNLLEKIITIKETTNLNPEDKKPVKFKDQENNKYILWKSNKEGETMAYAKFKQLPYNGDGATIGIAYAEEQKTFTNEQGKDITFAQKTVVVIKSPNEVTDTAPALANVDTTGVGYAKPKASGTTDWDKINDEKEKSMRWMNALNNACTQLSGQGKSDEAFKKEVAELANFIYRLQPELNVGEKLANADWANNTEQPSPPSEPVIQVEKPSDEIKVSEIPF
ncbi:MAG: hypothetical protein DRI86_07415 [Bacteroidetes bacterium]|nr:MAG: hypothetical protein DRI86_07415 [Bacteroidota bacterium]